MVQRLRRAAEGLANAPYKGVLDDSLGDRRRWVVAPYVIIYRVIEPDRVVVTRILDGRRDLPPILAAEDEQEI